MKNPTKDRSLLPYLEDGKGLFLRFTTAIESSGDPSREAYPFIVLNDTDPVARLVAGAFVTDTEDTAKALFVLLERDDYLLRYEPLLPVTNTDIEEAWQSAFSFYRSSGREERFVTFRCQCAEDGRLSRLAPLFFCNVRRRFFHPVCPRCGLPLQLCADDDRLVSAGLMVYSRSLKRYLSCGFAACEGSSEFYVHKRTYSDPPDLRDFGDLVQAFSGLLDGGGVDADLPCSRCDDEGLCFGEGRDALSRIVPFSFYPFYMLMFESMLVNGLDFSFLLSGAPPDELVARLRSVEESGRARAVESLVKSGRKRFLFEDSEKFFLEVLYLKLSFLASVISEAPDEDRLVRPGFAFALDRIWVNFADQTDFLPSYWTFKTKPLDVFWSISKSLAGTKTTSRPDLYYLALIWFYVLTANKRQDVPEITAAIREGMDRYRAAGKEPDAGFSSYYSQGVFSPSSVFWNLDDNKGMRLDETDVALWERCQVLGWSLLKAAASGGAWSKGRFLEEVEALLRNIRNDLFGLVPPVPHTAVSCLDDTAIKGVLDGIISKWRAEAEKQTRVVAEPTEPEWEEESVRTVILTSQTGFEATPSASFIVSDDLKETLLPSQRAVGVKPEGSPAQKEPFDDGMDKTVILSVGGHVEEAAPGAGQRAEGREKSGEEEDLLEKTAIISRPDFERQRMAVSRTDVEIGADMDDTVRSGDAAAVSPGGDETEKRRKKSAEEDDMDDTVILSPADKDRRR